MRPPRTLLSRAIRASLIASALVGAPGLCAKDLTELSLEELMDISITSVSRRETRLGEAAAAVTVVTAEDIRRFGISTLPDALRLATGMEVARVNSHTWAVSARGFQGELAAELLVMIDGRTIYEPIFAGVHWGSQDLVLEDLERIEVIRGPGATLWGTNAVNGVVNIITKNAADTHGSLLVSSLSTEERPSLTVRHGGDLGDDVDYRVYVKYFDRESLPSSTGKDAGDDWSALRGGFRLDARPSEIDTYMLQGEVVTSRVTEHVSSPLLTAPYAETFAMTSDDTAGNVLGRWTHLTSDTSQWTLQSFYSHSQFHYAGDDNRADTFDLDLQHQLELGPRHMLTWGAGYRRIDDERHTAVRSSLTPAANTAHLYTAFLQDELTLVPERLRFTVGSKFEHNEATGFEIQPGIRLAWTPSSGRTLWSGISRAVRTPDRFQRAGRIDTTAFVGPTGAPILVRLVGNPDLDAEEVLAYEVGYRFEPNTDVAFDLAAFYNEYERIIDFARTSLTFDGTATVPHYVMANTATNVSGGASYGVEASLRWKVSDRVRLTADYRWLHLRFLDGSREFDSPDHLAHVRGYFNLPKHFELSGALSYTDRLRTKDLPAHLQLDLGLIWHPTDSLETGLWGQSLLDRRQAQFTDLRTNVITEVPRSVLFKVTQRF